MNFQVEFERETDGRWIAEISELPGVLAYGRTREEALAHVQALALRVLAFHDRDEIGPRMLARIAKHTGLIRASGGAFLICHPERSEGSAGLVRYRTRTADPSLRSG
jgi:predicted RNase H-like HicB family nuclease